MDYSVILKPGEQLEITFRNSIQVFEVQSDPHFPTDPAIEEGSTGDVFRLREVGTRNIYALKVFKTQYRNDNQVIHTTNLTKLGLDKILTVARREILTSETHGELIHRFEYLQNALLMPWVSGYSWQEVLMDQRGNKNFASFSPVQSFLLAARLVVLLNSLENSKCAHCDLCSNNVVIETATNNIDFIDIDDIYGPGFVRTPGFIGGQRGYKHQKQGEHQWCAEGDRFGGAILVAELISWYSPSIRALSGSESYFRTDDEMHSNSPAFKELLSTVKEQSSPKVADLLVSAWESSNLSECPPISDWYREMAKVAARKKILVEGLSDDMDSRGPLIVKRRDVAPDITIDDIAADSVFVTDTDLIKRQLSGNTKPTAVQQTVSNTPSSDSVIKGYRKIKPDVPNTPTAAPAVPPQDANTPIISPSTPTIVVQAPKTPTGSASSPKPRPVSHTPVTSDSKPTSTISDILGTIVGFILFIVVMGGVGWGAFIILTNLWMWLTQIF